MSIEGREHFATLPRSYKTFTFYLYFILVHMIFFETLLLLLYNNYYQHKINTFINVLFITKTTASEF